MSILEPLGFVLEAMASAFKTFGFPSSPCLALNSEKRVHRCPVRCLASRDSTAALSSDSLKLNVNGIPSIVREERERASIDFGNGHVSSNEDFKEGKLEPLWDDGYGTESVKDYLDYAKDIIKPDGGPPRWFTPISCGPHLRDSPVLLFLPGILFYAYICCS